MDLPDGTFGQVLERVTVLELEFVFVLQQLDLYMLPQPSLQSYLAVQTRFQAAFPPGLASYQILVMPLLADYKAAFSCRPGLFLGFFVFVSFAFWLIVMLFRSG